jgi:hypothetical protein
MSWEERAKQRLYANTPALAVAAEVRKATAIRKAAASDSNEACEPRAKNALPSWPKKYEMPGDISKRILHASR